MNYKIETAAKSASQRGSTFAKLRPFLQGDWASIAFALAAMAFSSAAQLLGPIIIGRTVDQSIAKGSYDGVLANGALLFVVFTLAFFTTYLQTRAMGGVARRILFKMRQALFAKLQELPVAFFNENKSGDLISRINNDTDKLSQFFAQSLMQFLSNAFLIIGAAILLLSQHVELGATALVPAVIVFIIAQTLTGWVRRANYRSLASLGSLSGEIQESLANFKVVVAFNRLDYFRAKFEEANQGNYQASIRAGIANNIFLPMYGFASILAQLLVLVLGMTMIDNGAISTGLLIAQLLYVAQFYNPLRQLANVWSSFQLALAALDRVSEVLHLQSNLSQVPATSKKDGAAVLEFDNVTFGYDSARPVLQSISFALQRGKTYAFVGPTGGGKTTTASLMARLYDPTSGTVWLEGQDIRSFDPAMRAQKIGFILQEPILFTGTVRDNITYGHMTLADQPSDQVILALEQTGLSGLLTRFDQGLEAKVTAQGDQLSLGQKQLIAFMRAALRAPDLLILDEATANIDTVTEQLLDEILQKLPTHTTRVIIAHRLNTIANADEIFFVGGGAVSKAGSMAQAVDMLLNHASQS